ncbi:hypothetical protein HPB51_024608 [Rhipicephalus microplus]|uniref:Tick transposon n=1 Tax=Rhipicephalus microplus TaxID=6941 RepID=A0A9J6EEI5_RHIMP|nr:hypothetical protein HPB51_024608 [Rhipicephalus microplus]
MTILVLDILHYVASAWSAVSTSTPEHCFAKCGFGMDSEGEPAIEAQQSEAASSEQELNEAMNALGTTGTTTAAVVTPECQTIAEIIANSIATEDGDADNGDKHEQHDSEELSVKSADLNFGETVAVLDYICWYVAHQSDAESNAAFQIIEKCVVLTSERKKWQSTIFKYFES